jgi:hypothetical protein
LDSSTVGAGAATSDFSSSKASLPVMSWGQNCQIISKESVFLAIWPLDASRRSDARRETGLLHKWMHFCKIVKRYRLDDEPLGSSRPFCRLQALSTVSWPSHGSCKLAACEIEILDTVGVSGDLGIESFERGREPWAEFRD